MAPAPARLPLHRSAALTLAILAAAGFNAGSAFAYSRVGEVQVGDDAGRPCFGLPARELKRHRSAPDLRSIGVYDEGYRPPRAIWSFDYLYKNTPVPMSPGTCIVYGVPPPSANQRDPPMPLEPGRMYEVNMNAPTRDATKYYSAKFCLKAGPAGTLQVIQIRYHRKLGWSPAACQP